MGGIILSFMVHLLFAYTPVDIYINPSLSEDLTASSQTDAEIFAFDADFKKYPFRPLITEGFSQ